MAEIVHLLNAPITEALIDFRVKGVTGESLQKSIDKLKERLKDRYPQVKASLGFHAQFQFTGGELPEATRKDTEFEGYFFISQDGQKIVQFRTNGFTFNKIKPYTSWEKIYPEALELWKLYMEVANPQSVVRIALRYINHIKIPLPILDFAEYLTAPPNLPKLDQHLYGINGFTTRLILNETNSDVNIAITQTVEPSVETQFAIIILDIDASKIKEFTQQEIEPTLITLRNMKNNIFFNSITDKTLRILNAS